MLDLKIQGKTTLVDNKICIFPREPAIDFVMGFPLGDVQEWDSGMVKDHFVV
jgi:hypothetical protein